MFLLKNVCRINMFKLYWQIRIKHLFFIIKFDLFAVCILILCKKTRFFIATKALGHITSSQHVVCFDFYRK